MNFVNNFSEVSAELVEEIREARSERRDARAKNQDSRLEFENEELEDEILEDIKQNLEKINHHGKRADAIVKVMLEHSRTSTGEKVPTDINALANEYLRLSYHGLRAKDNSFNADYKTNFDPILPKVIVVPQEIGRPWHRTWWAYLIYLIILLVGSRRLYVFQKNRTIRKERDRIQQKELEQAKEIEKAYLDLKVTQAQLVQQEKLASLGQLTAGIAHEIKNPLNFVNNFSEVSMDMIEEVLEEMEKNRSLPAGQEGSRPASLAGRDEILVNEILQDIKSNLKKIHQHGTRANNIVTSMLQHSKGGTGKKEPTDLNSLVKEFVNLSYHSLRAGKNPINVDIQLDLDEKIGNVNLIAEDFSRVLLNLCGNAFDAMREKVFKTQDARHKTQDTGHKFTATRQEPGLDSYQEGSGKYEPRLRVTTSLENAQVWKCFEDNGPGIPDEIKDKILQPFFTTKKGTEGTGLGLSITNDIVKAHGGELKIETKENEGTTFTILLPL